MSINFLHSIFSWIAITAAILVVVSTIGTWWTGRIIDRKREEKIIALQEGLDTVQPRSLSPIQKEQLKEKIAGQKNKIGFVSKIFDRESENFAIEISKVFTEAGWDSISPINKTLLDDTNGEVTIFAEPDSYKYADLVCQSLNEVGITCVPQEIRAGAVSGHFQEDAIYIVVGSKK